MNSKRKALQLLKIYRSSWHQDDSGLRNNIVDHTVGFKTLQELEAFGTEPEAVLSPTAEETLLILFLADKPLHPSHFHYKVVDKLEALGFVYYRYIPEDANYADLEKSGFVLTDAGREFVRILKNKFDAGLRDDGYTRYHRRKSNQLLERCVLQPRYSLEEISKWSVKSW